MKRLGISLTRILHFSRDPGIEVRLAQGHIDLHITLHGCPCARAGRAVGRGIQVGGPGRGEGGGRGSLARSEGVMALGTGEGVLLLVMENVLGGGCGLEERI